MKTQIHRITADRLGIKPDKDGFYFAPESLKISIADHQYLMDTLASEMDKRLHQFKNEVKELIKDTLI